MTTRYGYATAAKVEVFEGTAACGKTTAVVARALDLARLETSPQDVVLLAPSPTACQALRRRVLETVRRDSARTGIPLASMPRVCTPRNLALDLLCDPAARAATGREARVLTDLELTFLREDLRVMGKQNRRLSELLKFLERGWCELREDDDGWLVTMEEEDVEAYVKKRLAFMGAFHPAEAVAACVRWLSGAPEALAKAQVPHILLDDARSTSRASHVLACMLARDTLTLSWDPGAALLGEGPYAYEGGLDELLDANGGAVVRHLTGCHASAAVGKTLANLSASPDFRGAAGSTSGNVPYATRDDSVGCGGVGVTSDSADHNLIGGAGFTLLESDSPDAEPAAVAGYVRGRIAAGVDPAEVFVTVPNDAWARKVRDALFDAGVATCTVVRERQALREDPRDPAKGRNAQMYAALFLAAEPANPLAWRLWCGFGDYLASSAAFADAPEALAGNIGDVSGKPADPARDGRPVGSGRLTRFLEGLDGYAGERRNDGADLLRSVAGLRGRALLDGIADFLVLDGVPEEFARLAEPLGEGADEFGDGFGNGDRLGDAATLLERVRAAVLSPTFADAGVRVGRPELLLGQTPDTVVLAGSVNGLLPERGMLDLTESTTEQRAKMRTRLVRRLYAACGCARNEIACSMFSRAPLETAERLRLDVRRIRLEAAGRVAELTPSVVVSYLSGETPIRAH